MSEEVITDMEINDGLVHVRQVRFAAACRARMHNHDERVLAGRYVLQEPPVPMWFGAIESVTSAELLALWIHHRKCPTVVQA